VSRIARLVLGVVAGGLLATALAGSGAAATGGSVGLRFATVNSDGSLVAARSQGAASSLRASVGKFKVVFSAPITRCAVSAASLAGNTSSSTFTYDTQIVTFISDSTLYVTLTGRYDGPADFPFSVVLACKETATLADAVGAGGIKPGAGGIKPGAGGIRPGAGGIRPGAADSSTSAVLASTLRFATVNSDGSLLAARSYGAASALRGGQGKFKIVFDSSLETCAVSAASLAGNTSTTTFTFDVKIATAISGSTLYVTLTGRYDGPADFPFSVVLACVAS